MSQKDLDDIVEAVKDMNRMAQHMRAQVEQMRETVEKWTDRGWSAWEPHVLKWPKRVNGRWYWRGDTVYRRERMRGLTGSDNFYQYGDEFDILKND